MSSEAANSSHCAEETAWSLLVHNSEADQQKTHQIWSPDNSINSNNGDVKPLYNVPTREYSHGAQRMAKEECGSNVELNSPDLDGVKSSMIQDGDQTLTLYDLNQNHEAKVTVSVCLWLLNLFAAKNVYPRAITIQVYIKTRNCPHKQLHLNLNSNCCKNSIT